MQYDAIQAQQTNMARRVKALNDLETQTSPRLTDNINISYSTIISSTRKLDRDDVATQYLLGFRRIAKQKTR